MKNIQLTEEQRQSRKQASARYREKNRDKVRQQALDWVNRQKEKDPTFLAKKAERTREYTKKNLEACRARSRDVKRKKRETDREEYNRLQREYRQNNPEKFAKYYEVRKQKPEFKRAMRRTVLRRYGLTQSDYESLLDNQEGKCAICRLSEVKMVIDHDHETGKVRSLLCDKCNLLIGWVESGLKRNKNILSDAAEYLKKMKH